MHCQITHISSADQIQLFILYVQPIKTETPGHPGQHFCNCVTSYITLIIEIRYPKLKRIMESRATDVYKNEQD